MDDCWGKYYELEIKVKILECDNTELEIAKRAIDKKMAGNQRKIFKIEKERKLLKEKLEKDSVVNHWEDVKK